MKETPELLKENTPVQQSSSRRLLLRPTF